MPIYVYQCPKCNEKDNRIVPMSESEKEFSCPACLVPMHKIFDVSGISHEFKGNWFKTTGKY